MVSQHFNLPVTGMSASDVKLITVVDFSRKRPCVKSEDNKENEPASRRSRSVVQSSQKSDAGGDAPRVPTMVWSREGVIVPLEYLAENYRAELPKTCYEAINGNKDGRLRLQKPTLKAIAKRKYDEINEKNLSGEARKWVVQTVIKGKNGRYFVLFEGWSSKTGRYQSISQVKRAARYALKDAVLRHDFCKKLKKQWLDEFKKFTKAGAKIKESDYSFEFADIERLKKNPNNVYWKLADLSYFHSKVLAQAGQAAVFYVEGKTTYLSLKCKKLPDYHMLTQMLLTKGAAEELEKSRFSKHIDDLVKEANGVVAPMKQGVCTSKSCRCNERYQILFPDVKRHHFKEDGRLDLSEFQKKEKGIIMECSDACGCDSTCPNRRVQNGTKKPLAVVSESEKGCVIRAMKAFKKGEFIAEYLGVLSRGENKKDNHSTSYQAGFVTFGEQFFIDAVKYGNVSRFPSHSCESNATFIEVYSRVHEGTVLVPRIGVFALQDIHVAEEITINYYPQQEGPGDSDIACKCFSDNCMKFLPKPHH